MSNKWYLETWFIGLMFALSILIVPFIVGLVLLILQYKEKKILKEKYSQVDDIDAYRKKTEYDCDLELKEHNEKVSALRIKIDALNAKKENLDKLINSNREDLEKQKAMYQAQINALEQELFLKDVSVFIDEKITSEEYKNKLALAKLDENELIKSGEAVAAVAYSSSKKERDANIKQIIRCFNSESAAIVSAVTSKNIDSLRGKLQRSFENLNNLFKYDGVSLSRAFLSAKLEQLNITYCFEQKKELEKEQQKAIKEQMIEEEKVRREIEKEKAKIEKEETQFKNEISKLMAYLQKAGEIEKQLYVDKIKELEDRLKLVEKDKENVLQREQNTRAGFVYVISNIGSFGEDVYKIGMTRRLEPMDRVKELGDASVPFEFDVHAMIFSEDAPALETILHNTFRENQVNKVNDRKEFFRVDLKEVEKIVKENYNSSVTFTYLAEAKQYRESLKIEQERAI